MSPYAHYAPCPECGADAGTTCMGPDDLPAIEVCDGRELAINDSAARTKAPRAPGTSPRTKARRRHSEGVPVMVACEHCASPVRLWGMGMVTGVAWCSAPACRAARKSMQAQARWQRDLENRPEVPPVACFWCHATIPGGGMRAKAARPICDAPECRRARKRELARETRAKVKT
jgi:hypothetical protein